MTDIRRRSVLPTAALVVVGSLFWVSLGLDQFPIRFILISLGVGAVYLAVIATGLVVQRRSSDPLGRSPEIASLRRCRWMALAGLSASVSLGASFHIALSRFSFPFFWVFPVSFVPIAWIVAFARAPGRNPTPLAWIAQSVALAPLLIGIAVVTVSSKLRFDPVGIAEIIVGSALFSVILLLPDRLALWIQMALVVLVCSISTPFLIAELCLVAATCRSCQGAAVIDVPPVDRWLEFAFVVLAGQLAFLLAYSFLPRLLFPALAPEYTIVIVAALLVRILPWQPQLNRFLDEVSSGPNNASDEQMVSLHGPR